MGVLFVDCCPNHSSIQPLSGCKKWQSGREGLSLLTGIGTLFAIGRLDAQQIDAVTVAA